MTFTFIIYFHITFLNNLREFLILNTYCSSISEFQNSIYDDSYIVQPEPRIEAGAWQQAGALCPIYESSYIKFCNSEIELWFMDAPQKK